MFPRRMGGPLRSLSPARQGVDPLPISVRPMPSFLTMITLYPNGAVWRSERLTLNRAEEGLTFGQWWPIMRRLPKLEPSVRTNRFSGVGGATVQEEPRVVRREIETTLVDLSDASLDQVLHDLEIMRVAVEALLGQVERPRFNIGGSMPPGRAD